MEVTIYLCTVILSTAILWASYNIAEVLKPIRDNLDRIANMKEEE